MCDNDEENVGRKMSHEILCHESYQVLHYQVPGTGTRYALRFTGTTTCGTHLIPEFPGGSDFEFALDARDMRYVTSWPRYMKFKIRSKRP